MTTIVWATDPHLSDKAPESRTDDWATTVLDKIAQVGEVCRSHGAVASVWGGDIFNLKSPDLNPHRLVIRLTKTWKKYPCPVYSSVGNHDLKWSSMQYLGEAAIEELFAADVVGRLYDTHEHVVGVSPTVKLTGVPYHGTTYDLDRLRAPKKADSDYLVCVVHCLASPDGGTLFEREDVIKYADLLEINPEVDCWCFGHFHANQGVTEIAPGKIVVNVGSLSRGSLHIDNLDRVPECVVVKFGETLEYERIPLVIRPAAEVFDLGRRVAVEARETVINAFVDSLSEVLEDSQSSGDFETVIQGLPGVLDTVRERALAYIERAKAAIQ